MTVIIEPGVSNTDAAFADTCRVCRDDLWASNDGIDAAYPARFVRRPDPVDASRASPLQGFAFPFTALIAGMRVAQRVLVIDAALAQYGPITSTHPESYLRERTHERSASISFRPDGPG